MLDFNSLPIPSGIIVAGITWAVISGVVLGPFVAERTIKQISWQKLCESKLRRSIAARAPQVQAKPKIACSDIMRVFGNGANQLCGQGGDALIGLLQIDPLARQKEHLRRRNAARLARIASLSPSRCSCAASVVSADRFMWGLYAGSARMVGGPQNLKSNLTQALYSPACRQFGGMTK